MWMLTLICALGVFAVGSSTEIDEFEYLQRTYDYHSGWTISPVQDVQHDSDEWPGGLYTLLMSKYGCPRGRWNRGYISFTWRTPHDVMLFHTHPHYFNSSNITLHENNTQCHRLLSEQTWPTSHTNMFGPFSPYKMTLNFCQRISNTEMNNPAVNSAWPQAYFSLFDASAGCPDDFYRKDHTIILPAVEIWTANGFLPSFDVESQSESTIFKLGECVRESLEEINTMNLPKMTESAFIFTKHVEYPCPTIERYESMPEIISLDASHDETSEITHLFHLCYYQPDSWNDHKEVLEEVDGYDVGPLVVLYGGNEEIQETYVIPDGSIYNYTVQAGNDKWSLLRYGGVEIPSTTDASQFVGRYIIVVIPRFILTPQQFDIHVLVADAGAMCMLDLGMADGSITRDQISSSDQTSENIDSVRAYESGWCASSEDLHPYIQVDLLEETVVDGITLYNWYKYQFNTSNSVHTSTPMGTRVFALLYSSDGEISKSNNTMRFYVDMFRPADEPQMFIIYEQIITRIVRILLLEPMSPDEKFCIRFELHGCRHNGLIYTPPLIYRTSGETGYASVTKTLISPSQFTSVGYPLSYEDGTSYTWVVDFRKLGFIKIIFEEISLQSYEDRSFPKSWYHCKDEFTIRRNIDDVFWSAPTSQHYKNIIIETAERFLVMEFTSCRPHTPRYKERTFFKAFVESTDMPTCTHINVGRIGYKYTVPNCPLSMMMVSPLLSANVPTPSFAETWHITMPHFTIRLTLTYFNILCDSELKHVFRYKISHAESVASPRVARVMFSLAVGGLWFILVYRLKKIQHSINCTHWIQCSSRSYFGVYGQFMTEEEHDNCNPPKSVLLSESESISIKYGVNPYSLAIEAFRLIYSTIKHNDQHLLDTIGYTSKDFSNEYVPVPRLVYKACSETFMKCYTIYTGKPMSWQVAGEECWVRGRKLVQIRSTEEMFVVKYMLRTWKYDESKSRLVFHSYVVDPTYYTHIGISRTIKTDGQWEFVGQDGSTIPFAAWNRGQPKTEGNCVRMSFHLANTNNTWEVEDCFAQMSLYFVCEETVNSLPDFESAHSRHYTGKMNTTESGLSCIRWDSILNLYPFYPNEFLEDNLTAVENYCRDPYYNGYLWCYTVDPVRYWGKCPALKLDTWDTSEYTGRLSTTVGGFTCQRWDSQYPHSHSRYNNDSDFPDNSVSDAANYCRDHIGEGAVWCYTTDHDVRYDYCDLTDTISDRCYGTHYPYNGTVNVTYSGLACQRWDSTFPHVPHHYDDTDFPEGNKTNVKNYCRDPINEGYIWCYTTNPDVRREACSVQINYSTDVSTRELYTCSDGNHVAKQTLCNGIVDCTDATDEQECPYRVQKLLTKQRRVKRGIGVLELTHFVCGSKEIVSFLAHCDGIVDCIDGSDEKNCKNGIAGCSKDEMQCGDGSCIHASLACDFIPHCMDFSDEDCDYPECSHGEFKCKNGQCIPVENRCNAKVDCIDGSDEHLCDGCSNHAFHCDLTKCIPDRLICDNIPDCVDMSDETNCIEQPYPTCEERWMNGLNRNGHYIISDEGARVECNFDSVYEDGSISTIIGAALDTVEIPDLLVKTYTYVVRLIPSNSPQLDAILNSGDYKCNQTFMQRCSFAVQSVANAVDKNFENDYRHCRCVALTVTPFKPDTEVVHDCYNKTHILDDTLMFFTYELRSYGVVLGKKMPFNTDMEITVGPITCTNDVFLKPKSYLYEGKENTTMDGIPCQSWVQQFPHAHNYTEPGQFPDDSLEGAENFCRDPLHSGYIWCLTMDPMIIWQICNNDEYIINVTRSPCEDKDITYPDSIRCMYGTDDAGYMLGCRNGRHLQDCSDFNCPNGTVKCPGSYCIPLQYICDGIKQCPGNEDEAGCGCSNEDLELILIVSAEDLHDHNIQIRQLAGQFNHGTAIVRIVSYKVHTDMDMLPNKHLILEMTDIEVNMKHVMNIEHECSYNILASDYIGRVRFTNASTRGIIYVQNGTVSQSVARHVFHNMSEPDFDVYRVVIRAVKGKPEMGTTDEYNYVTDITVKSLDRLTSIGSKIFPSLCKDSSSTVCPGNYKCLSSMLCIESDQICDGHEHCPFHDDEMFCDFVCPSTCLCSGYSANCTSAVFENSTDFTMRMDKRLRVLDLSTNKRIGEFVNSEEIFVLEFPYMIRLNLSLCNILRMSAQYFERLPNLRSLDLSRNKISTIPARTFYGLTKLVYLNLHSNVGFLTFESFAFVGLVSLRHFEINEMDIRTISPNAFSGLKLYTLHVSHNNIIQLSNDAFSGLAVSTIFFESNNIKTFDSDLFNGLSELKNLRTSAYKYCCIRPDYLPESACFPERDEFSSCDDLMRNSALQTLLWLLGICALVGNILAVVYCIVYDRERLKIGYGIFVTNLAVADFFMGVYLLIIAIADSSFRKRYIFQDEYWRNSGWCTVAGILSTVSSEASVLFVCLITLDRFLIIKYPFRGVRFTPKSACIAASIAWLVSISISATPLIARQYFEDKFYSKSGVCVALPLTRDRQAGWLYAVVIFIGVNFITFIGIALGQLSIYLEKKASSKMLNNKNSGTSNASRQIELTLARNLLLVVATDFCCWIPIGCMGIMALAGYVIPGEVYAWIVVFVLPVNSALNPVLYTLTVFLRKRKQQDIPHQHVSKGMTIKAAKKRRFDRIAAYILPQKEVHGVTLVSIKSVLQQHIEVTPKALLNLTAQLTRYLHLFHKNSMIIEQFDTSVVFVTVEHGKVTGDIKIFEPPIYSTSFENRTESVYTLGVIVSRLLECNSKQN